MSEDDRTDRGYLQKLREEMEEKSPLEAVRDDMNDLKERAKDAVRDDDEDGDDDKPIQPSLDDEPRMDESDESRALPGDRPSERTKSGFNRK